MSDSTASIHMGDNNVVDHVDSTQHHDNVAAQDHSQSIEDQSASKLTKLSATAKEFVPCQAASWVPNASAPAFNPETMFNTEATYTSFVPVYSPMPYDMSYYGAYPGQAYGRRPYVKGTSDVQSPALVPVKSSTFRPRYYGQYGTAHSVTASPLLIAEAVDLDSVQPLDGMGSAQQQASPSKKTSPKGDKKPLLHTNKTSSTPSTSAPSVAAAPVAVEEEEEPSGILTWAQRVKLAANKKPPTTPKNPQPAVSESVEAASKDSVKDSKATPVKAEAKSKESLKSAMTKKEESAETAELKSALKKQEEPKSPKNVTFSEKKVAPLIETDLITSVDHDTNTPHEQPSVDQSLEDALLGSLSGRMIYLDEKTDLAHNLYSRDFLRQFAFYCPPASTAVVQKMIPSIVFQQPSLEGSFNITSSSTNQQSDEVNWRDSMKVGVTTNARNMMGGSWRVSAPVIAPLKKSEDSWAVKQAQQRLEDDQACERFIRGILNKLTVEKFDRLSKQLFETQPHDNEDQTAEHKESGQQHQPSNDGGVCIKTLSQLSTLIKLIFEKATQQHHFIPMYADLCRKCADWLGTVEGVERMDEDLEAYQLENLKILEKSIDRGETGEEEAQQTDMKIRKHTAADFFKTALIEKCQEAFDAFVNPPEEEDNNSKTTDDKTTDDKTSDDKTSGVVNVHSSEEVVESILQKADEKVSSSLLAPVEAERLFRYRTEVWGNLKLVGRLIGQKIISSRIAQKCIKELLSQGVNDTLIEALAVFLTEVGPVIDFPEWSRYTDLEVAFQYLSVLSHKDPIAYLDHLKKSDASFADLTFPYSFEGGKLSSKVRFAIVNLLEFRAQRWVDKSKKGPATIAEIHKQQSHSQSNSNDRLKRGPSFNNNASQQNLKKAPSAPWARSSASKPTGSSSHTASPKLNRADQSVGSRNERATADTPVVETVESLKESVKAVFVQLKKTQDEKSAIERLSLIIMNSSQMSEPSSLELASDVLAMVVEKGDKDRAMYIRVFVESLVKDSLASIVQFFVETGPYQDLKYDIPKLPQIIETELLTLVEQEDDKQGLIKLLQ